MATRRIVPSFDALPPDAKLAADKATVEMDRWIDEKIDTMAAEMGAALTSAVKEIQGHVAFIESELSRSRKQMEKLLISIKTLKQDLEFGDGVDINEAIENTRTCVETVRAELAAREVKWKSVGSGIVNQVSGVIGKVIPISL